MVTFVQDANCIDYTPATAVEAGAVVVQGSLVGVAKTGIEAGKLGALALEGVYDVPKASATTFAAGAAVYFDASNKVAVATSNSILLGHATQAAVSGGATVRIVLNK